MKKFYLVCGLIHFVYCLEFKQMMKIELKANERQVVMTMRID